MRVVSFVAAMLVAVGVMAVLAVRRGPPRAQGRNPLATEYRKDLLVRQVLSYVDDEYGSLRKLAAKDPAGEAAAVRAEIAALRLACKEKTVELLRLSKSATERRLTGAVETALAEVQAANDRMFTLAATKDANGYDRSTAESERRRQDVRAAAGMLTAWRVERIVDARSNASGTTSWRLILAAGVGALALAATNDNTKPAPSPTSPSALPRRSRARASQHTLCRISSGRP